MEQKQEVATKRAEEATGLDEAPGVNEAAPESPLNPAVPFSPRRKSSRFPPHEVKVFFSPLC